MPSLSPTMTSGNLSQWKKRVGDPIAAGDVLAEIETDKATVEFECQDDGFLAQILVPDKSNNVPVNEPIAILVENQDDVSKFQDMAHGSKPQPKDDASRRSKDDHSEPRKEHPPRDPGDSVQIPVSNMRKIIAQRLTESMQTIPHFYLTVEVHMDKLLDLRKRLNGQEDTKLTINDFVIKATALTLKKVPQVNGSWNQDTITKHSTVDISVAVSTPEGLITPIIKDADKKTVQEISKEMKDLGKRAKENLLKAEEFQGGSFTISNLGMYGLDQFCAIINPPQSAILAVGGLRQKPRASGDAVQLQNVIKLTLSCDHRVIDGALGAKWLATFREAMEAPEKLVGEGGSD